MQSIKIYAMLSEKEKDIILEESIALCKLIISNTYKSNHEFTGIEKVMIIGTEQITEKAQEILNKL